MVLEIENVFLQGRSQEFATGDKRGGLGDISSYDGRTCTHVPLGYATVFLFCQPLSAGAWERGTRRTCPPRNSHAEF